MTNTGKVLIIGLLVIDFAVGGYLLIPKDDESPRPPAVAGQVVSDTGMAPGLETADNAARTAPGSAAVGATPPDNDQANRLAMASSAAAGPDLAATPVTPALPSVAPPVSASAAPPVVLSTAPTDEPSVAPSVAHSAAPPTIAAAPPVVAAAPHTGRATPHTAEKPRPTARTSRAQALADAHRDARAKSKSVQLAEQGNGRKPGDHRHDSKSHSKSMSAAMTAQLVRESSQPDPSLPPPPSGSRRSHPVSAAMTDQLVRESSRVQGAQDSSQYGKH